MEWSGNIDVQISEEKKEAEKRYPQTGDPAQIYLPSANWTSHSVPIFHPKGKEKKSKTAHPSGKPPRLVCLLSDIPVPRHRATMPYRVVPRLRMFHARFKGQALRLWAGIHDQGVSSLIQYPCPPCFLPGPKGMNAL